VTGGAAGRPVRVVVADDQHLVRTGFRMILESEDDIEVVGEAADGAKAVELCRRLGPDVVLMDVRMPTMDGIEATRRITASNGGPAGVRVLMLTTFDLDDYVYAALRNGASGFLLKDTPPEELVRAVRLIVGGDALLAPSVTRRLVAELAQTQPRPTPPPAFGLLTSREREVLTLVARGLSNAEIAQELVVGETTVKTHVGRMLTKLGLRDRVQAVVMAYETGLVRPSG
jgi:DNA-binding NarL/FixJ family response regulator